MFIRKILFFILIVAFSAFAQSQEAGIVLAVNGDVRIEGSGVGGSVPAAVRSIIYQDDLIITGADGRVQILFRDDTVMSVSPDTELSLEDFDFSSTGNSFAVNILKGVARVVTGEIVKRNPENFNITTPHANISIRGTTVTALVLPSGTSAIVNNATLGFPVVVTSHNTSEAVSSDVTGMALHVDTDGSAAVREATSEEMRMSQAMTPSLPVSSETNSVESRNDANQVVMPDMPKMMSTMATFSGALHMGTFVENGTVGYTINMANGDVGGLHISYASSTENILIEQAGSIRMDDSGYFIVDTDSGALAIRSQGGTLSAVDWVYIQGDTANITVDMWSGGGSTYVDALANTGRLTCTGACDDGGGM